LPSEGPSNGRNRRAARWLATVLPALCFSGTSGAGDSAVPELGRKVFTELAQPSCSVCHTLQAAGATGQVGPALDELKPDAQQVALAVRNGIGVMPAYEGKLSAEQIEAVAQYVARATRAGK
jgi:mono/diheme cytochrome c family protein